LGRTLVGRAGESTTSVPSGLEYHRGPMSDDHPLHGRQTKAFNPDVNVGWQYAVASLERLNSWAVTALRLGTLWLLQRCIRDMSRPGAKSTELLKQAQELLTVLERLPWD